MSPSLPNRFPIPAKQADAMAARSCEAGMRSAWTPICSLGPSHREHIQAHLLALGAQDRYLRFGHPANDAQIERYVQTLHFERDELFGVFDARLNLIALSHLAFPQPPQPGRPLPHAEFSVSVLESVRRRGLGRQLFEHAVTRACNRRIDTLHIYTLSENAAMLRIARKAGAVVERDGSESAAYLKLPPGTFASHVEELFEGQVAGMDYQFKCQIDHLAKLMDTFALAGTRGSLR